MHSYVPLGLYGPGVVWERPGLNKKGRRRHQMAKNDPKMTIFRPRESGATPNLGSCGSGYGGYLGGIHLPTGRAHQEGSTRPDTAPPGAMCVGVGVFFGVFTRRYVGTQAGSMDQGGLWTGVGYLSGSMEGILSSHEPTGPACGCLTLFMFMKVNANGRAVQSLVIWSSLGVQSYAPFWPDTADTSGSIHPPKIPHERAGLGRLTTHLHGPHVHAN